MASGYRVLKSYIRGGSLIFLGGYIAWSIMEEDDLIELTPHNYQEWSQLAIRYLSQHNTLPYVPNLEYNVSQIDIVWRTLFLFMEYKILKKTFKIKSSDPYVFWMHLWATYEDPNIPPFPKYFIWRGFFD